MSRVSYMSTPALQVLARGGHEFATVKGEFRVAGAERGDPAAARCRRPDPARWCWARKCRSPRWGRHSSGGLNSLRGTSEWRVAGKLVLLHGLYESAARNPGCEPHLPGARRPRMARAWRRQTGAQQAPSGSARRRSVSASAPSGSSLPRRPANGRTDCRRRRGGVPAHRRCRCSRLSHRHGGAAGVGGAGQRAHLRGRIRDTEPLQPSDRRDSRCRSRNWRECASITRRRRRPAW